MWGTRRWWTCAGAFGTFRRVMVLVLMVEKLVCRRCWCMPICWPRVMRVVLKLPNDCMKNMLFDLSVRPEMAMRACVAADIKAAVPERNSARYEVAA